MCGVWVGCRCLFLLDVRVRRGLHEEAQRSAAQRQRPAAPPIGSPSGAVFQPLNPLAFERHVRINTLHAVGIGFAALQRAPRFLSRPSVRPSAATGRVLLLLLLLARARRGERARQHARRNMDAHGAG